MAFPIDNIYESVVKEQNINDGGYVQMEWNSTDNASLAVGTTCPIDSDYILFSTYHPSQQTACGYHYSVKFLHRMAQLDYLPFYFKTKAVTGVDGQGAVTYEDIVLSTYPYTGNIQTIAEALADCLSDHGDLGQWTADTSGLSGSVTASINFDGATVKGAAQAIADAFGVDYQFIWSSRTIKFGSFDMNGDTPAYGRLQTGANGITESVGTLVSATDGGIQYNTFRILGGTRNMSKKTIKGQNVQVTQRLMLDTNGSILGGGSPKIMKDLVFDDIYPKMELWMYDVHERRCWLTDENGKKIVDSAEEDPETGGTITHYKQYSKWYFKLAYWNGSELVAYSFDPSLIIAGLPLSMVFQPNYADGALPQPLVGREFELTYFDALSPAREKEADDIGDGYQPVHGEFRIIFKVEGGMILPSTSEEAIRPYGDSMSLVNNKVTLVNVAMDEVYKQAAKAELLEAGQAAMAAYTRDKSSFTYLTYGTPPALGGNITMVRQDLITGEVQYTVGNYQNSKGLIGRLSDKIDTIGNSGGNATTGEDGTGTRGGGVSELSIPLLSRLMGSGSVIKDSLTILRELILGTNGHGVFIDNNGDASMTIGSLTVLGTTHLNEIDINHIKHTGGMLVVTKANIIVDHVEHLSGGLDKLYFRRVDGNGQHIYNQFEVGDLALMMVYNEALDGSINRYYWREVSAIDDGTEEFGYIILLPSSVSHSEPREGDVVVQLGNTTKAERQGATVLGGSGPFGGFFAVYDGFTTWRESAPLLNDYNTAITYISPKKNKFNGDSVSIAGQDLQSQLDALRASLLSVSQQSDKQLVIWYGDEDAPLPNSGDLTHYNDPAKDWHDADVAAGNTDQQELHLEDVYYLRRNNTTRVGGRAWQWTYDTATGKFLWVEITDVDTLAALEAADDAVATANEAKQKVENFGDDGIISAGTEKSELLIMWQDTVAEYVKLIEQGQDYDLDDAQNTVENNEVTYTPYNDYERRYYALALMLNGNSTENINSIKVGTAVPAWLQSLNVDVKLSDYSLTATDYRTTWKNYFDSRAALQKAIEGAALAATEHAQTDATNALNKIGDMGNDAKLDPSEKLTVKREFLAAWRERAEIIARCMEGQNYVNGTIKTSYIDPYVAAFLAVATYLNGSNGTWYTDPTTHETSDPAYSAANALDKIPLWLHTSRKDDTETINGDTWRNLWSAFYAARTALLTALSEDAKDKADAAQQAADDAQETADKKKRVFSTSANELPPAPYDVGDLWVNAVWYTEKDGVRTFKWTGDVLYCIQGRSTNANRSINDWSDAASGTTAKIANLGTQIEAEVRDRKNGTSSLLKLDPTSGSLTVNVYNAATDTWSSIGNIELALARGANGIFSKLNLTADNVEINASLVSVIADTLQAKVDNLDFKGGTVKIDAANIAYTVGCTSYTLGDGIVKMLVNTLSGYGGSAEPTGLLADWADAPGSANSSYPYLWMRVQKKQNGAIISTSYHVINIDGGLQAQFTASVNEGTATSAIHNSYMSGAIYMRTKGQDDAAWGVWTLIEGETGDTIYSFARSRNSTAGNASASTQALQRQLGMVIRREGYSGEFSFGSYVDGTFEAGLQFVQENGYSKLKLTSDSVKVTANDVLFDATNVAFGGKTISFNGETFTVSSGTIDLRGATVRMKADDITFNSGKFSIDASHITFTSGSSTFNMNSGLVTLLLDNLDTGTNATDLEKKLGMVIRANGSNGEFSFGSYVNNTFKAGLQFKDITEAGITKTKLLLTADNVDLAAGVFTLISQNISIGANQVTLDGKTVSITSSSTFTLSSAGTFTLSGGTINVTGNADVSIKSGASLTIESGSTLTISGASLTISANTTITLTSGKTLSFSSGTIDFTASKVNLNAEQINFKSGSFAISNSSYDTFKIDSNGNVTMRGLTATNVDVSGKITATSGSFTGTLNVPADAGTFTYANGTSFGLYMDSSSAFQSGRNDYLTGATSRGAILRIEQLTSSLSFRGIYGNCEVEIQGTTQLLRTASNKNNTSKDALIVEGVDNKGNLKVNGDVTVSGCVKTSNSITLPECTIGQIIICTNPTSITWDSSVTVKSDNGGTKTSTWNSNGQPRIFIAYATNCWREFYCGE